MFEGNATLSPARGNGARHRQAKAETVWPEPRECKRGGLRLRVPEPEPREPGANRRLRLKRPEQSQQA